MNEADKDEIAADVRNFINTKAYKMVFAELQEQYLNQLISLNVGDLKVASAHASLRALGDIQAQLKAFSEKRMR